MPLRGTPTWRFHTELCKFQLNVSAIANNSTTEYHIDLRLGRVGDQILAAGISQSDWPFNNRAVNGSKLSTRFAHNFDPTATSAEVKCVALINSRRSRRIVTISFSPENGVWFDASCLSPGVEKYSNSEVCTFVFRFIASCLGICI